MKILKFRLPAILLAALCIGTPARAQSTDLSPDDRNAIQALMTQYAQVLAGCRAEEFADLFVPGTGYFSSGFRGHMAGRERLIALVQSERQCTAPSAGAKEGAPRPGGATGPTVELMVAAGRVRGIAKLGTAEYQDEYAKTPQGWRFASRTVIMAPEKAAGLDAREMLAVQSLGADKLGDHYEPDQNGVPRLMTSGVKVSVTGNQVTGRAYLKDKSYDDQFYEKAGPGQWRVKSSTHGVEAAH